VGHAVEVLVSVRITEGAPPAAKALLATLAKLLASACAPGSALHEGLQVRHACCRRACRPCQRAARTHGMPSRVSSVPACDPLRGGRQDALMIWAPDLLRWGVTARAAGRALPAALLPYAAAQLLPLLLLPPERVRTLSAPRSPRYRVCVTDWVSVYLSKVVVRPQPLLCGRACSGCANASSDWHGLARAGPCVRRGPAASSPQMTALRRAGR